MMPGVGPGRWSQGTDAGPAKTRSAAAWSGVPRELPTPLEVLQADREALPDGAPIASPVC
jgi:hypothetical protein